eukprot:836345-Pleurochrysis_carterae.AAC.1
MSLPDAIRFGIYDSGSDHDDNLILEDNDVQEVRPVVPHSSSIAICHDDDDDDDEGPILETNVAVVSPALLFWHDQVLLVLVFTLLLKFAACY